ncbi:NUDIX hydrolase [Parapusillimonas granuli]|uniref:CoA pyrophosphatase n=1 Tax=Parapusillimonas granuli TaxID=380911 RepID=A0A853FZ20_9BURK|nr:CoA pyrophosphatase [Parapusillimonas granuli]MBB5217089.1 8-oxo-dGTP pyrophosphatase MutT (NUDIX family) [Parapusillimonas granuli]NYT50148.1 CoA pyrophosphatase [Parapusillimonas granuli]
MSQNPLSPRSRRVIVTPVFDPLVQPVLPVQPLRPLRSDSIQLDFIQSAFLRPFPWQVEPLFRLSFEADPLQNQDAIPAAVFFPLVQRPSGLHVLFTRRASHLYDHAGQICFPGGRIEATDSDEIAAALRETREEIGVSPEFIQLIGKQPDYLTSSRFIMKPVVGLIRPGFQLAPDVSEVAEVFEVPLSVLMDPGMHRLHRAQLPDGGERLYFSITWKSYFIWGATAALIRNFYRFLSAAQDQ